MEMSLGGSIDAQCVEMDEFACELVKYFLTREKEKKEKEKGGCMHAQACIRPPDGNPTVREVHAHACKRRRRSFMDARMRITREIDTQTQRLAAWCTYSTDEAA